MILFIMGNRNQEQQKKEAIIDFAELEKIIKKYITKKSHILLVGDFNAKIGNDLKKIMGGDTFLKL